MWKPVVAANPNPAPSHAPSTERFFKVQMKAWTSIDPIGKSLEEIAEVIERGDGFLTSVEILEATDSVASISDEEVRDGFASTLAAKMLLNTISNLPLKLKEELRSALDRESDKRTNVSTAKKGAASSDLGLVENRSRDISSTQQGR
jgi:hypothetical protein